jgi:hypothetical protein
MMTHITRIAARLGLVGVLAGAVVCLTLFAAPAQAATALGAAGSHGAVYGFGGTVCNPFLSSGFARRYIEIGSPLVGETNTVTNPGISVVGGGQTIRWQPWLEKWVGGRWVTVWVGGWYGRLGFQSTSNFGDPFIDVYQLGANSGAGNYRTGGTIQWVADSSHAGGWVQYRHSAGNYFKDGYANLGGASATPLTTEYCWAG